MHECEDTENLPNITLSLHLHWFSAPFQMQHISLNVALCEALEEKSQTLTLQDKRCSKVFCVNPNRTVEVTF